MQNDPNTPLRSYQYFGCMTPIIIAAALAFTFAGALKRWLVTGIAVAQMATERLRSFWQWVSGY